MAESLHILLGTSACLLWLCHSGERTVGLLFFLFLLKNIDCGYSLEQPRRIYVLGRNVKIIRIFI